MTYEVKTQNGYNGWTAESTAEIGKTPEGTRVLELTTSKNNGGLAACANVYILKDLGDGFHSKSTVMFQDFRKHNIAATPCKRVTENAVIEAHNRALLKMDEIVQEAKAFYANQPEIT